MSCICERKHTTQTPKHKHQTRKVIIEVEAKAENERFQRFSFQPKLMENFARFGSVN